jgi:hypothetical protein
MLPKQVVSYAQLIKSGLGKRDIESLTASLKLFPTPFKGIYYVPLESERKGQFIEKPMMILSRAIDIYLGTKKSYFSCSTAEEMLGIRWQPSGEAHIVNEKISKKINLKERIRKNRKKGTYRAKKVANLLSFYGDRIIFHKTKITDAKIKQTPYGRYAKKSQINKDKKKFGC